MQRRVVITGMGVRSSLGNRPDELFDRLKAGECGVRHMPEWESWPSFSSKVAAPAPVSHEDEYSIKRIHRRTMGRLSLHAALAAREAVSAAGLSAEEIGSPRVGCIIGSTTGSAQAIEDSIETLLKRSEFLTIPSTQFFKCISHTAALNVAQMLGVTGTVMAPAAACASSLQALGLARALITSGSQDLVICGGAEEVAVSATAAFDILYATSTNFNDRPESSSRPFAADRDGLVCGGGAGILVLEDYEHALNRRANIFGELIGYATCASGSSVSQSASESIVRCLDLALEDAGIGPEAVDYVCAHATATMQGDAAEAAALGEVFGDRTPVSSLKGHLGHTLGASGAIELVACLEMMRRGEIIPTLNLDEVAEDCATLQHVTRVMQKDMDVIVKNCFAFGGINAILVCQGMRSAGETAPSEGGAT